MRFIGLDVHRDFCVVAISQDGQVRVVGKVLTTPDQLAMFADSLGRGDQVALEATSNALVIARMLERSVDRLVIATRRDLQAIARAKHKTDRLDATMLARLLAGGFLSGSWLPDDTTRAQRLRLSRRSQLVRSRTRVKNEIHAVLIRNLKGKPPVSDLFGKAGRVWLAELDLPGDERETVDAGLRHVDFLTVEVDAIDRTIAANAAQSADVRRLMGVPGVSVITAATFIAAICDIHRFQQPGHLVGYLGLDPKVRQSGSQPGHTGHISKEGPSAVRHTLTEAAMVTVRSPGPIHVFYERLRARRGHQVAIIAVARKLAVLFWHLLTRQQDYAFTQPTLTRKKLRRLELAAGATPRQGQRNSTTPGVSATERRDQERAFCRQAETAYRRLVTDWQPNRPSTPNPT